MLSSGTHAGFLATLVPSTDPAKGWEGVGAVVKGQTPAFLGIGVILSL